MEGIRNSRRSQVCYSVSWGAGALQMQVILDTACCIASPLMALARCMENAFGGLPGGQSADRQFQNLRAACRWLLWTKRTRRILVLWVVLEKLMSCFSGIKFVSTNQKTALGYDALDELLESEGQFR